MTALPHPNSKSPVKLSVHSNFHHPALESVTSGSSFSCASKVEGIEAFSLFTTANLKILIFEPVCMQSQTPRLPDSKARRTHNVVNLGSFGIGEWDSLIGQNQKYPT